MFSIATVVLRVMGGIVLLFQGNLFLASLGIVAIGSALFSTWYDQRLASIGATVWLPATRGRLGAALNILAGAVMAVAAATQLHPVLAAFVLILSIQWIFLFAYALRWIGPLICPTCGAPLTYVRADGTTLIFRCEKDGVVALPPDGRLKVLPHRS